ncbi:MAG: 4'-phosphopantetheinyl transferase superfamily protein [Pseudomonadota bacterium]|nr:4'-phosphopantetheinyl transferase superfamily protein [Pseudomonadota bacterium]
MSVSVLITSEFVITPTLEAEWLDRLPPLRRTEISRWRDDRARQRSLLGSRLLAEGLHRLGYSAAALTSLRYPPQSRPTLDLPVNFSLSHCDGRIVCALSTRGPIGIDVEGLGGLTAGEFRLYLSAAERAWAGRSARRFYSVWTRKEAVAKAAGSRGLRDAARVDTTLTDQRAALEGRLWHTPTVPVGRGYVAHLALADEPCDVTFEHIGRQALERDARPIARDASVAPSCAVL